jgi:O-antigen ligase
LSQLLVRVDREPFVALLGGLLGAAIFAAQLTNRHEVVAALAFGLIILAVVAPTAGLTGAAAIVTFRPPAILGIVGFAPTLVFAISIGCFIRLLLERPSLKLRFATLAIVLYGVVCVYDYLRVGGNVILAREIGTTVQMVDIGSGLVLLLSAMYLGTRMGRGVLFATVLAAMGVVAMMGLITWSPDLLTSFGRLTFLRLTDYTGRAFGPFFNPNYFGVCEALVLVFIAAWPAGPDSRWWKLARLVVGFCVGAGLVMSMARGAVLAAEVGLVVLAFLRGRRTGLMGLVLAVLFLLIVFPRFVDWRLSITFGPDLQRAHAALDQSSGWRLDTLVAGLKLFRNDPIFGVGLGQFHYLSPRYLAPGVLITYSHDSYVDVLAEQGLLGVGAYLLMMLGIGWTLLRSAAPGVRGLLALFAVFLVPGLTTEPVSSLQTTGIFWILLGVGLASALAAGARSWPSVDAASIPGGAAPAAGGI